MSSWPLKSRIVNEMHRAQRQVVNLTVLLQELHEEQDRTGKCASETVKLGLEMTELIDSMGNASSASMHALTLPVPAGVLEIVRCNWGKVADLLTGTVDLQTVGAIRSQVRSTLDHLAALALQIMAKRQHAKNVSKFMHRSRN